MSNNFDSDDLTGMYDTNDINQNKALSIVAYIPVLFLITWLAAGHSPYAKFNANQGLILTIFAAAAAMTTAAAAATTAVDAAARLCNRLDTIYRRCYFVACLDGSQHSRPGVNDNRYCKRRTGQG